MIQVAGLGTTPAEVRYTGIDLFEARSPADGPGVSLKVAHRLLSATGARIRLVPGEPSPALARTANSLAGTDLVIISPNHDPDSLTAGWFYLPRLLHAHSVVFAERTDAAGRPVLRRIGRDEIDRRAAAATPRRAA